MTNTCELLERARAIDVHDEHNVWNNAGLIVDLADALEAAEAEIERLRALFVEAEGYLDSMTDCGPDGEGWKSPELSALIRNIEDVTKSWPPENKPAI